MITGIGGEMGGGRWRRISVNTAIADNLSPYPVSGGWKEIWKGCWMIGVGRPKPSPEILGWRVLTDQEILDFRPGRAPAIKKIGTRHHLLARLIAAGLSNNEISQRTGYSAVRISTLKADPSFVNLITEYRAQENASFYATRDEYYETILNNGLRAELLLADKLDDAEEDPDRVTVPQLVAIARDAADRVGYGKQATRLNVNADFASLLDKAIARSQKAAGASQLPAAALAGGSGPTISHQPLLELQAAGAEGANPSSHTGMNLTVISEAPRLAPDPLADSRQARGTEVAASSAPSALPFTRRRI